MLTRFLARRFEEMLVHPDCWGSAEAYELQALLLLEMQLVSSRVASEDESLLTLNERYAAFLHAEYPDLGVRPLSAITGDYVAIADSLRKFRDSLVQRVDAGMVSPRPPSEARRHLGRDVQLAKNSTVMPRVN
jgi:hypothetical protein